MGAMLSPPAFSSDGRLIAAGSTDRTAKVWDIASGTLLASKQHQSQVLAVAFLPGGAHLVTASADRKIRLWDTNSEAEPIVVGEHQSLIAERNTELAAWLAVSPNGKHIASATSDGHISIWTLGAGEPPVVSPKFPKPVVRASFSHDGRRMVAVAAEQAWLWDGTKGKDPVAFGDFPETTAASFSPDGKWIVLGNALGEIRIVDSESRENVSTPWQARDGAIATVEFAPDGRRVLTTVRNNVPRLWDVASGADIAAMSASARGLTDDEAAGARTAIFSPDGWIATTSLENDLRLWPAFADTQSLIDYARAVMPRPLTAQQRKDFFLDAREIPPRQ
jgi:WD40 repeat protein